MEAGGGWQGGPRGAGQGQAGRHLAGGHGPYVRDVPPLVSLAPAVSDVEEYHWPSLGVFFVSRKWRIVTGGGGWVGSNQSGASGSYQNGPDRGCCIGHCTGALKICTLGMSSI